MKPEEEHKQRFSNIVLIHFSALKRFAFSLCRDPFETDDLVSETVMKAFENFSRLKEESKAKQWLFRILNNQFITNYRAGKKYLALESHTEDPHREQPDNFSLFEALAKSDFVAHGDPEKTYISKLTQQQIQIGIDELPEEFRATLILCDIDEFSYAEIADILKIPVGTVRSRIARARNILQTKLWQQAQELGIKSAKSKQKKKDYVCTCGEEENETKPEMEIIAPL